MKTVYAISSGAYSDYRVHWLLEDKEEAERLVNELNDDGYDAPFVEEFDLAEPGELVVNCELSLEFYFEIDVNEAIAVNQVDAEPRTAKYIGHPRKLEWNRSIIPAYGRRGIVERRSIVQLKVYGTDHERVRKVYSDSKAELLATPSLWLSAAEGGLD